MHRRHIFYQHAARAHPCKNRVRGALAQGRTGLQPNQHHVGLAREGTQPRKGRQRLQQRAALGHDVSGLGGKDIPMLEREQRAFGIEHADVVGRTQLVDLGDQGLRADQVADAHAGQSELAHGAHQQHMRMLRDAAHEGTAGKRLISLVYNDQAWRRRNDLVDHRVVPQVGRRVVGVGQVHDGRSVPRHRVEHRSPVEFKLRVKWHADEAQSLQLRAHPVHHEPRNRGQHAGTGSGTGHREQRDQLIGTVAHHQAKALRNPCMQRERAAQGLDAGARVAVQRDGTQPLAELLLQLRRQSVGVFHGVELDHPCSVLHRVRLHGLDVGAQHKAGPLAQDGIGHAVIQRKRISAARAWACSPSP